jgi:hypothetical protein
MRQITHDTGETRGGVQIKRHFFINDDKTNYMTLAHSQFTREDRRLAKLEYKNN